MEAKPIALARTSPPSLGRGWGRQWKAWLAEHANSIVQVLSPAEGIAYPDNTLDLDPICTDAWGNPRLRITFSPRQPDLLRISFLRKRTQHWLKAMGATEVWTRVHFGPITARAIGGARMGDDPRSSVVNHFSISHEVPNLVVTGGATFLSAPGPGPTGTIQALAWRTADHLVKSWDTLRR
jgi:gluconate 2-dehydrogenase alpha chain